MRARISSFVTICGIVAASIVGIASPASAAAIPVTDLLRQLTVAPESNAASYDRDLFQRWIDADGDGCDTRSEVLQAETAQAVTLSSGCTVATGLWNSWYDGYGWSNASDVDIDHLVPLAEAWRSGAWSWTAEQRRDFANDLGFDDALVAVTDEVNQAKGDKDPSQWMPPFPDASCRYVGSWISMKFRWALTIDTAERDKLAQVLTGCGSFAIDVTRAIQAPPAETLWPLYKIIYSATVFELITNADGSTTPVPLTYARWRDVYHFAAFKAAPTGFVKYSWSPTVYAVTFWPGGESKWQWERLTYPIWAASGFPTPRNNAGWTIGSTYYRWQTGPELFVLGEDGVKHKLTAAEWSNAGNRAFAVKQGGFWKLTWAADIARVATTTGSPTGTAVSGAEWAAEGYPTPSSAGRYAGDRFYMNSGDSRIWYAGPVMNRPISYAEWSRAGFPTPEGMPTSGGGGGAPANPGNSKNCDDFTTQAAAQKWFDTYFPSYGDIAQLDADGDLKACESLP